MSKIENFLEKLPEKTKHITMRSGESRKDESNCGRWSFPISDITSFLDEVDLALPYDGAKFRLIAHDEAGKQFRSLTNQPTKTSSSSDSAIDSLVDGYLLMGAELRRSTAILNETIENQQETIEYLVNSLVETKEESAENTLAIGMLEMENQSLMDDKNQSSKEKALGLAESIVGKMLTPAEITPETIKEVLRTNPELVQELAKDASIQELFMEALIPKK
tara:strand:+ start:1647 stop:2306 length:660 start_codon:yes stop_codon:yes gene_type:complete